MKYCLTSETQVRGGITLHRIKRLSDNALGGWIESEKNLSQSGAAWVSDDAQVSGTARVFGDAQVFGAAEVSGTVEKR